MRIAVCFSGQLRTAVESSDNIKRYLGFLFEYCDFFIHTWNINQQKVYNLSNIFPIEEKITDEYFKNIIDIYQPKNMMIENYHETYKKESEIINNRIVYYFDTARALWYSFKKSIELKLEYEEINNFEYDLVIKLRTDVIFPEDRRLSQELELYRFINKNEIFIENIAKELKYNIERLDDVFFIGNSKTMDKFSKFYSEFINNSIKVNFSNGVYGVYEHLILNNIFLLEKKDKKTQDGYSIYRPECFKYSPLTEYNKCRECDAYYYAAGPGTKELFSLNSLYIDYLRENYNFEESVEYVIDDLLKNKKLI